MDESRIMQKFAENLRGSAEPAKEINPLPIDADLKDRALYEFGLPEGMKKFLAGDSWEEIRHSAEELSQFISDPVDYVKATEDRTMKKFEQNLIDHMS